MLMNLPMPGQPQKPVFGQPTNTDPYQLNQPEADKKKMYMMIGGGILLVIMLLWVVLGGKATPGEAEMKNVVKNTSESLAILDKYNKDLSFNDAKNDLALVQILVRDNYTDLNTMYTKTFKPKKRFSTAPQPDADSKETLDSAQRSNQLDSKMVEVLKLKVLNVRKALVAAKVHFSSKEKLEILTEAQQDFEAINEILEQPR